MAGYNAPYTVSGSAGNPFGYTVHDKNGDPVNEFKNGRAVAVYYPEMPLAQAVADALTEDDSAYLSAIRAHGIHPYGLTEGADTSVSAANSIKAIAVAAGLPSETLATINGYCDAIIANALNL